MTDSYDCVIVGAGHNGLICAADLAEAGWNVLVLERRNTVGGACVTEETWPGFQVSTASYVVSLLLPEIEQDLELARHGYRVLPRNPSSFTPTEDGGCEIDFCVDFTFRNAVFEALAGQYFDRAFRKMVQAFEDRADELYGRENAAANL